MEITTAKNLIMKAFKLLAVILIGFYALYATPVFAQGGDQIVKTGNDADRSLPKFPETTPQLYNEYLVSVPDIKVETVVGQLPPITTLCKGCLYK